PSETDTIGASKSRSFLSWWSDRRVPGSYRLTRHASGAKPSNPARAAAWAARSANTSGIAGQRRPLSGSWPSLRSPVRSVAQPVDSVPEIDAIGPARAVHRTVVHRDHPGIAPPQRHHLGPRLHAWALLGQHEFAAGEILFRLRQQNRHLQREDMLAVEILVESVVVARGVLQQERRWPRLPRLVAARDE